MDYVLQILKEGMRAHELVLPAFCHPGHLFAKNKVLTKVCQKTIVFTMKLSDLNWIKKVQNPWNYLVWLALPPPPGQMQLCLLLIINRFIQIFISSIDHPCDVMKAHLSAINHLVCRAEDPRGDDQRVTSAGGGLSWPRGLLVSVRRLEPPGNLQEPQGNCPDRL